MKNIQKGKKLISLALAFALLISLFSILPLTASAAVGDTFEKGGFTYTVLEGNTISISKFDNSTTEVVIPETVNYNSVDYKVTSIVNQYSASAAPDYYIGVFVGNKDIVSVEIPGSIENIPNGTFKNCTALKSVKFNEGLVSIGSSAFNLTALEKVSFPKSLKEIKNDAFAQCNSLKEVEINSDVSIMINGFRGSPEIEDVYCYSDSIEFASGAFNGTYPNITFHGNTGSTAQTYATQKGFTFVLLEEEEETTTKPVEETTTKPVEETTTRSVYIYGTQSKLSKKGIESFEVTGSYKESGAGTSTSHTFNAPYLGFMDDYDVFELKLPVDLTSSVNFKLQDLIPVQSRLLILNGMQ